MSQVVRAVYENGILRPLDQLDLAEHQHVRITVDPEVTTRLEDQPHKHLIPWLVCVSPPASRTWPRNLTITGSDGQPREPSRVS